MTDEQQHDQDALLSEEQVAEALDNASLLVKVETLEAQLADSKDQALRAVAEMQNIRRRAEQDVEKAHKFALEKFAGDLLAVVDSLERGTQVADASNEAVKPMLEGMQLTLKQLLDTLDVFRSSVLIRWVSPSIPSCTKPWLWKKAPAPSRTACLKCSSAAIPSAAGCCAPRWWW